VPVPAVYAVRLYGGAPASAGEGAAAEAEADPAGDHLAEVPAAHAVDYEVTGRVEGDDHVRSLRDVAAEQDEPRGGGCESQLYRPRHLANRK